MEITITIKIENEELKDLKTDFTEEKSDVGYSQYAKFFDAGCPGWSKDSECNLVFLKSQQDYCNEVLRSKGYLFLNDVYDVLGMPRTKAGQCVGWIYDKENPIGDNRVDFNIYGLSNKDFVNGYERTVLLDFNVDGNILDYL